MEPMSALTTPAGPAASAHTVAAIRATVRRTWRQIIDAWHRRTDAALLASFDDYMLRDIGLTRGDLNDALAEPLWRDPTAVLVRRQRERRAWRRCSAAPIERAAAPSIVPEPRPGDTQRPAGQLTSPGRDL
jgi:uncharacterized protein YjiS (DUF1127 family)